MNQIAAECDCDVAASDDLTGHADLGGDWDLEYTVGDVTASVAFSTDLQNHWFGLLDITTGLTGHWTLDSDGADSSGNSNDGTLEGNAPIDTTPATNKVGPGKLALDGNKDYLDLSSHAGNFGSLSQGTIAAWINTSDNGTQSIVGVADGGDPFSYSTLGIFGKKLFFDVAENSS